MNYTENYKGIKLDVQAIDISIDESVQAIIRTSLDKLLKHVNVINFADFYLKEESTTASENKYVSIRIGIPGPDAFADDRGAHFESTIREVTGKLVRQLEKAKA